MSYALNLVTRASGLSSKTGIQPSMAPVSLTQFAIDLYPRVPQSRESIISRRSLPSGPLSDNSPRSLSAENEIPESKNRQYSQNTSNNLTKVVTRNTDYQDLTKPVLGKTTERPLPTEPLSTNEHVASPSHSIPEMNETSASLKIKAPNYISFTTTSTLLAIATNLPELDSIQGVQSKNSHNENPSNPDAATDLTKTRANKTETKFDESKPGVVNPAVTLFEGITKKGNVESNDLPKPDLNVPMSYPKTVKGIEPDIQSISAKSEPEMKDLVVHLEPQVALQADFAPRQKVEPSPLPEVSQPKPTLKIHDSQSEQRTVQVRIGTVEVQAITRDPLPQPVISQPTTGQGFDSYVSIRNYRWQGWE